MINYILTILILLIPDKITEGQVIFELRLHSLHINDDTCASVHCILYGHFNFGGLRHTTAYFAIPFMTETSNTFRFNDILPNGIENRFIINSDKAQHNSNKASLVTPVIYSMIRLLPKHLSLKAVKVKQRIANIEKLDVYEEEAPHHFVKFEVGKLTLWTLVKGYCEEGFYGKNCEKRCDLPRGLPSKYVRCDGSTLRCRRGWTGLNCRLRDPCTFVGGGGICQNGAECVPTYNVGLSTGDVSTFRCLCKPGWIGHLCATPVTEHCLLRDGKRKVISPIGYRYVDSGMHKAILQVNSSNPANEAYIVWRNGPQTRASLDLDSDFSDREPFYLYSTVTEPREEPAKFKLYIVSQHVKDGANMTYIEESGRLLTNQATYKPGEENKSAFAGISTDRPIINSTKEYISIPMTTQTNEGNGTLLETVATNKPEVGNVPGFMNKTDDDDDDGNKKGYPKKVDPDKERTMWLARTTKNGDLLSNNLGGFMKTIMHAGSNRKLIDVEYQAEPKKNTWRLLTRLKYFEETSGLVTTASKSSTPAKSFKHSIGEIACVEERQASVLNTRLSKHLRECRWKTIPLTFTEVADCHKYRYLLACYTVPCILLKGDALRQFGSTDPYVEWTQAISFALPELVNWKVKVDMKTIVTSNKQMVTSINLNCLSEGAPVLEADLVKAFLYVTLVE